MDRIVCSVCRLCVSAARGSREVKPCLHPRAASLREVGAGGAASLGDWAHGVEGGGGLPPWLAVRAHLASGLSPPAPTATWPRFPGW